MGKGRTKGRARRAIVHVFVAVVAALALAHVAIAYVGVNAGDGVVGSPLERFFTSWVHAALLIIASTAAWARVVARSDERGAWTAMAIAITAWTAGELHYTFVLEGLEEAPYPSLSDALWLLTPVAAYGHARAADALAHPRSRRRALAGRHHRRVDRRGVRGGAGVPARARGRDR